MPYEFKAEDVYSLAQTISAEVQEKGDELFFRLCPYCHGGDRSDRNTFSVNLRNGTFNCFRSSCGRHGHFVELARDFDFDLGFSDSYRRVYRKLPQKQPTVTDRAMEYLASRGIGSAVARRYRVTTHREHSNILVFPFYDEQNQLQFIKYRKTDFDPARDKNKEWCEKDTKPILFGMQECSGLEQLVITEGQIDSLSLAEAGIANAVSVPTGAMGFTWLENCWDWVSRFREVVVFGDCERGKVTLLDTLQKRLAGQVVKSVQVRDYLGEKDANDILRKYGADALRTAVERAAVAPVSHVKELADVESVDIYRLPRIFTNIPEIDRIIGGLFFGQVALLTGRRGEGKSTFMSQLIVEAIEQNYNVFAYSGELKDYHFKRWVDLQCAGPDNISVSTDSFGDEVYFLQPPIVEQISRWYRGHAYIFDNDAVDDEMEDLPTTVERAVCRYGIKLVCIDNLMTAMDVGMSDDLYRAQSMFVKRLKQIAVKYDVAVILVAHPRKSSSDRSRAGFDNDDVGGSSDITNRVDVVMSYSRNLDKPEGDDSGMCDSKLTISKNRLTGKLTRKGQEIELFYSNKSKRITSLSSVGRRYSWERPSFADSQWETIG